MKRDNSYSILQAQPHHSKTVSLRVRNATFHTAHA